MKALLPIVGMAVIPLLIGCGGVLEHNEQLFLEQNDQYIIEQIELYDDDILEKPVMTTVTADCSDGSSLSCTGSSCESEDEDFFHEGYCECFDAEGNTTRKSCSDNEPAYASAKVTCSDGTSVTCEGDTCSSVDPDDVQGGWCSCWTRMGLSREFDTQFCLTENAE